jgi:transposase-like protein
MKKSVRYSPEVMERAVRMVQEAGSEYESQWAAITSIAAKIGCTVNQRRKLSTFQRPILSTLEGRRARPLRCLNR